MFQCVNCNGEINGSISMVCPHCHTNPIIFGSQPYSGVGDLGPPDPVVSGAVITTIGAIIAIGAGPVGMGIGLSIIGFGIVRGIYGKITGN